ncbi:SIR2 family protein [Actinomadura chibensis]|uniref:Uncharacterized protein n=1 Tax=Actinomadura chibensis TaxID=392828 RepID=A0A5D0NUK3_9ACTN|nr:SIR2 family protein [Actinomadura chibensis]TYB47858.1 hypothetical protein FXF69_00955 [Actinomadura chibensis]
MTKTIRTDEAVAWLTSPGPCLSIAGAGLSIPAPACAPSVPTVISETLGTLAEIAGVPEGSPDALSPEFRERLLPESCYAAIAAVMGTARHLKLWGAYDWVAWRDGADAPRPNAGHHLLAQLAARDGLPILTTNFDCFLEAAVRRQGRRAVIGLPARGTSFSGRRPRGADEVAVWKLHGSAADTARLRSQSADLVRSSFRALRGDYVGGAVKILVVGYSGRDFDVFPWLFRYARGRDVLWVDRKFDGDHRARTIPGVTLCETSFEDLAREYWRVHDREPGHEEGASAVKGAVAVPASVSDTVRSRFERRLRDAVRCRIGEVVTGEQSALEALAVTLNTVADFPQTVELLTGRPDPCTTLRGIMALQFAEESMDQFVTAGRLAVRARSQALRRRDVLGFGRAQLAVVNCRFRDRGGIIQDRRVRSRLVPRRLRTRALAGMVVAAWLLFPLFGWALLRGRVRRESTRFYDALDFAFDYIEHLVRICSVVAHVLQRLPAAPRRTVARLMWTPVGFAARLAGYMRGVLNVAKYRARLAPGSAVDTGGLSHAEVVGDVMAGGISARDAGQRLLALSAATADPAERSALRGQAEDHLVEALRLADVCGNPSLALKVLLVMKDGDLSLPVPPHRIDGYLQRLEGAADNAAVDRLRALLA